MASLTYIFLILLFSVLCFSSSRCCCYADLDEHVDDDHVDDDQAINPPSPSLPGYYYSINISCSGLAYFDLCVTSLRSDSESHTDHWALFPMISLGLSLDNITDTKDYINQLLLKNSSSSTNIVVGGSSSSSSSSSSGDGVTLKESLKYCEERYGQSIQSVKASLEYYHSFKIHSLLKNAHYARNNVSDCEKEIEKIHNPNLSLISLSPLKQKNTLSFQLLTISYNLALQLL